MGFDEVRKFLDGEEFHETTVWGNGEKNHPTASLGKSNCEWAGIELGDEVIVGRDEGKYGRFLWIASKEQPGGTDSSRT